MGDFHELNVWEKSKELVICLYKLTNDGGFKKKLCLARAD